MRILRIARLALGEAGWSPWRGWPLAAGLALGVATWIFLVGFTGGVGQLIRDKVSGSLPDRLRVSGSATQFGPIQMEKTIDDTIVEACRKIPGVINVYRQAHYPGPCQLYAEYGGQSLRTDLILEAVDPGQVEAQVANGRKFEDPGPVLDEVPVVVPEAILDILNAGISAHTSLPTLTEQALIGKHFTLVVGASSFAAGEAVQARCTIVGVSDQLGVSGPAVPLEWMRRYAKRPVTYHTLTLQVAPGTSLDQVVNEVQKMGLAAPGVEMAERISAFVGYTRMATTGFSVAILLVAAIGVSTGISLQIREEKAAIGLLRALGATRNDITSLFVIRAGLLGLTGALAGMLAGLAAGYLVSSTVRHQFAATIVMREALFQPGWSSLVASVLFALAISLISGLFPARAAASLSPAQVLRGS